MTNKSAGAKTAKEIAKTIASRAKVAVQKSAPPPKDSETPEKDAPEAPDGPLPLLDLSDAAVKKVKGAKYRALSQFEKLTDVVPSWSKSENWRIAREMDLDEIRGTDLLHYLESL